MEKNKFILEILRCENGFFVENKSGKFVFKDATEILGQMGKELEKMNSGETMIIEYSHNGKQD